MSSAEMPETQTELEIALKTVAAACEVARTVQRNLDRVREITKDDRSPVTVADFAVQAIVHMGLSESLGSGDGALHIVGEESASALRDPSKKGVLDAVVEAVSAYRPGTTADDVLHAIDACDHDASAEGYWALDPVDGTKGFLRGQQYAVALARIENGEVVLGVMGCPNLPLDQSKSVEVPDANGSLYSATRSGGAWEHREKRQRPGTQANSEIDGEVETVRIWTAGEVSGDDAVESIRVCESVESEHSKQSDTARILEHLRAESRPVRLDSQCKYAVVARGQADAYLRLPTKKDYVEKIWDHAAGMLIATEAGAIVTDVAGRPLDFSQGTLLERNRGIVCATPCFHSRILAAIEQLGINQPM
jgi:HAL2 family 3'(2'),5'-bisphosphate nucleotidase